MKNFCTVADINFYNRVCALECSLSEFNKEYKLHLLCLDRKIEEKIKNNNIICYHLDDIINNDRHLKAALDHPPSREALIHAQGDIKNAKKFQFIWALSAYFSWWTLENLEIEDILYIDADIFFFSGLDELYSKIFKEEISIGIVEHRCPYNPDNGKYNVGIVYFKNDLEGYKCSTWWKNCLITTNHDYYKTHSGCGDQKYLELFPKLFRKVGVLDKFIGHLAPWNFNFHQYNEKIIWNNVAQDLLYCHFSNFKIYEEKYDLAPRHGFVNPPNNFIKNIANKYFECLKRFPCD